jgi:hypothetical protein
MNPKQVWAHIFNVIGHTVAVAVERLSDSGNTKQKDDEDAQDEKNTCFFMAHFPPPVAAESRIAPFSFQLLNFKSVAV